jgi:iron(III) transport system substrate-binding protein
MHHRSIRRAPARGLVAFVGIATVGGLLAACGSSGDGNGTAAATTTTAATTAAPATSASVKTTEAAPTSSTDAGTAVDDAKWQETVQAAEKEGKVVFYSSAIQGTIDRLEAAFEAKYPKIDMQATRVTGVDLATALENERNSGSDGADIVLHDPQASWYNNLDRLTPPIGPNTQAAVWKEDHYTVGGVAQMHHIVPFGIAYNTNLVKTPPKDFTALLDPSLKGLVGLFDMASPASADLYTFLEKQYGAEFLTKLAQQNPQYFPSVAPTLQALTAGEIAITDYANAVGVADLVKSGAPVAFAPTTPQWAIQFYTYIVNWAKHKNAAQVLYDYMASPEGQTVINQGAISVLPDIPNTIASIDDVQPIDVEKAVQPALVDETNVRIRKIFGR